MKKTLLFISIAFFNAITFASELKPEKSASTFSHLKEVNQQWEHYKSHIQSENKNFSSDLDRIQFHLFSVEKLLRNNMSPDLSGQQLSNRLQLLDVLHDYASQKIFPVNTYHSHRQPYFIDIYGTHCAVGYLVKVSGYGEVSQQISRTQNYAYVHEIQSPELVPWSQEFGFTLDELALIQPAYAPTTQYQQVQGGTNGPVEVLSRSQDNENTLLIGGNFTSLNNMPCLNAGYYANDQLNCFGNGIEGKITGIYKNNSSIIAGGKLISNGNTYPIAIFNGSSWDFESIPNRTGAEATAFYGYYNVVEIAINHPTDAGKQEIWVRSANTNTWNLKAVVNGQVYSILQDGYHHVYAGVFNTISILENETPNLYTTKNALIQNMANLQWGTVSSNVSDTIFTAYSNGQALFLGGSASSSASNVCVSRYMNGTMQSLLLLDNLYTTYACIKDLEIFNNQDLIVAGNFDLNQMMYFGKQILKINLANNYITPLSMLNKTVNAVANINGTLYFGGEFTNNGGTTSMNHLITMTSPLSVKEIENKNDFEIMPNPSGGMLYISDVSKIRSVSVVDVQGKIWLHNTSELHKINGTQLPSGIYIIQIEGENNNIQTRKWIKI